MAYNPLIPQPEDLLSTSQQDIADNFTALEAGFSINHDAFNNADKGNHNFVQFVKVDPTGIEDGPLELIIEDDTRTILFTQMSTSHSMLPSGVKFKFGVATLSAVDTTTVSLVNEELEEEIEINFFNIQFTVLGINSGIQPSVIELTREGARISNNGNQGKQVYYFAIGY